MRFSCTVIQKESVEIAMNADQSTEYRHQGDR